MGFYNLLNENVKINKETSFQCGDAAGRISNKPKDFSDSDYKFSLNCGLKFYTPEQYFLNKKENIPLPSFNPMSLKLYNEGDPLFQKQNRGTETNSMANHKLKCVLMIGPPGSGKSTFIKNHLLDFIRINQDALKTKGACITKLKNILDEAKFDIVIDNTFPS